MHPRTFVAPTTPAHVNRFYKAVLGALEFDGPALICCYTTCQPERGVADNMPGNQARIAVETRAFPLLIYDPRSGEKAKERLSLQGNPAVKEDGFKNPKTGETVDLTSAAAKAGSRSTSTARAILRRRCWRSRGSPGELAATARVGGVKVNR